MIYLDSCALVKLLVTEQESPVLAAHLDSADEPKVSTEFAQIEVRRALIRVAASEERHREADELLNAVARLPIGPVLDSAARLPQPHVRSGDAVHLATARALGPAVREFITYDKRLAEAAADVGLPVVMPGT